MAEIFEREKKRVKNGRIERRNKVVFFAAACVFICIERNMHKESVHRKDLGLVVFHQLRISIITISTDQICIESVYVKEYSSNPAFALTCHFLVLSLQLDRRYTPRWCILVHACIFYRRTRDSLSKEDTKQVNVLLCRVFVLTGP